MRTLLRSIRSGEYLQTYETWTASAGTALDFESISHALDLVRRRGLKDMELVLTDEPAQTTILPVAKLPFAEPFIEETTPSKKPHLKQLDRKQPKTVAASPAIRKRPRKIVKPSTACRKTRPPAKSRLKG